MIFGSVCSGIEAASVAWIPLGWRCAFVSEIDPFCNAVLAYHYPEVPNYGDFRSITGVHAIDVLVGGTPCQSFSVAGLRKGLDDDRGNLAIEFIRLADRIRPRWLVWENVCGVLSSNKGRDFGTFLSGLAECGYGFAYRVLDAQYFGVPQRRRRVFLVGYPGNWRPPAAVLFERTCLSGDPSPRCDTRQEIATTVTEGIRNNRLEDASNLIAPCLTERYGKGTDSDVTDAMIMVDGRGRHGLDGKVSSIAFPLHSAKGQSEQQIVYQCHGTNVGEMGTLRSGNGHITGGVPFTFDVVQITSATNRTRVEEGLPVSTLNVASRMHLAEKTLIRRLTPRECERLQGFPDDFTLVPYRGKPATDSPRYRALGNSMAVPVVRWLGERIQMVDALIQSTGRKGEI